MNQNPFGGQDPFEYLRRQMEEQLRQKQQLKPKVKPRYTRMKHIWMVSTLATL